MSSPPTPDETVPTFILDQFYEHSPETLHSIGEYANGQTTSQNVPDYIVEAFVMQDDATKQAVGNYAHDLAEYLDSIGADSIKDATATHEEATEQGQPRDRGADSDGDDDDDDGGPYVTGPFFG